MRIPTVPILFALLLSISSVAYADTPSCGQVIEDYIDNGLYNILHITKTSSLNQDFASYFFSQEFESTYENNKQGLSVTIPFQGIPITFGGSNESQDAWQIRQQNQQATKWDFSQQTFEEIYIQRADDNARQYVVQMMSVCYSGNGRVQAIVMANDGRSVQILYTYGIIEPSDPLPVILNFVCSIGLECDSLNAAYSKKLLVTSGQTFSFLWSDMTSVAGSVTLNTSRGSATSNLSRTIYAPTAILTFTTTHPAYVDGGAVSTQFNVFGVSSEDCNWQPCSPDGKWQAWDSRGVLQAPEITTGAVLRNPSVGCTGDFAPFSSIQQLAFEDAGGSILPGASEGPKVTATIREWSGGCLGRISAEQFVVRNIPDPNVVKLTFTNNNMLVVDLPKGSTNASLQLSVNNKPVTFAVGAEPVGTPQVKLLSTTATPAETIYTYVANQSVPGPTTDLLRYQPIRSSVGDAAAALSVRSKRMQDKKRVR